jgi:hypothetical protein
LGQCVRAETEAGGALFLMRRKNRISAGVVGFAVSLIPLGCANAQDSAPAPALKLLVGAQAPALTEGGAVLRLGPADSVWTDGEEVILPRHQTALARGAGSDDATCLAQAVYYESRGEPVAGQQAVAQVVMNRLGRYAPSVCGVVFQRSRYTCQFSFACDGAMDRPVNLAAWSQASAIAHQALGGFVYKPMKDATHFHAVYVTPPWSSTLTRVQQIGQHIFYR